MLKFDVGLACCTRHEYLESVPQVFWHFRALLFYRVFLLYIDAIIADLV